MSRAIYGVYFICCVGHYAEVVEEQLRLMESSGLLRDTKKLLCFICNYNAATMAPLHVLRQFVAKYPIELITTSANLYERYAIENYKSYIMEKEYYMFYIHTKGVSHKKQEAHFNLLQTRRRNLNHFIITKHRICRDLLSQGNDAVGTAFSRYPVRHFSGNFWWARSEHVMRLPCRIRKSYLAPEMYICGRFDGKYVSVCQDTNQNNHEKMRNLTDEQIWNQVTKTPLQNVESKNLRW